MHGWVVMHGWVGMHGCMDEWGILLLLFFPNFSCFHFIPLLNLYCHFSFFFRHRYFQDLISFVFFYFCFSYMLPSFLPSFIHSFIHS